MTCSTPRSIHLAFALSLALLASMSWSQPSFARQDTGARAIVDGQNPYDHAETLTGSVSILGHEVEYDVTFGKQPVYDEDGNVSAALFYTFYERTNGDPTVDRPLMISFNGGPGSASVWMHLGYTGPKRLKIDAEGFPVQPYGVRDNEHSILDVADIVFVNPVNVAFSRVAEGVEPEQFFGVDEDVAYLADWIDTFVTRHGRWTSPKFLIGESYGTTRVRGLAAQLQGRHWMYLNGVILVSPTGLGVDRDGPVRDANYLPYFAATAWYHNQLDPALQERDLTDLLAEVEAWAMDTLLPALARGGSLPAAEREALAEQAARYAGLEKDDFLQHNLRVPTSYFWKDLLREDGLTVGRLDSRYRGVDRQDAGVRYDFDPALTAWNHAFAPAINQYLREELGYATELQYNVFGPVSPWNRDGDRTGEQLRSAMAQNPYLHVMVQAGYFDGGTDYFNAKYTMWNMDPSGDMQARMRFRGYESGHMMYLRDEDLVTSNQDIREFVRDAVQAGTVPARY